MIRQKIGFVIIRAFVLLLLLSLCYCKKDSAYGPPDDVSNVHFVPGASKVDLFWDDPINKDLQSIEISYNDYYVSVDKGVQFKEISGLLQGNNYQIIIKAIDSKGKKSEGVHLTIAPDYRVLFVGNYNFRTIVENWMMGQPTTYDTVNYSGIVTNYLDGDNLTDMCSFDNPSENSNIRLTIEFMDNVMLTPEVLENGVFIQKSGYHYGHNGSFILPDSVVFYVGGFGGLGGGTNYSIRGIRH